MNDIPLVSLPFEIFGFFRWFDINGHQVTLGLDHYIHLGTGHCMPVIQARLFVLVDADLE